MLLGTRAVTHWIDGGAQSYLTPTFTQVGPTVTFTISDNPIVALPGYYIFFAMVDDIPSHGIILPLKAKTPEITLKIFLVESGMVALGWNSLSSNYLYTVEVSPTLSTGTLGAPAADKSMAYDFNKLDVRDRIFPATTLQGARRIDSELITGAPFNGSPPDCVG